MATITKAAITQRDFIGARAAKQAIMELLNKGDVTGTIFIGSVIGRASGSTKKESSYADPVTGERRFNTVLQGIFRAHVAIGGKGAEAGDEIDATGLFLPGPTPDLMAAELDQGSGEVLFASDLYITPRGAEGDYSYVVKNRLGRKVDPLADVLALAHTAGMASLPVPRTDAQTLSIGGKMVEQEAAKTLAISSDAVAIGQDDDAVTADVDAADADAHSQDRAAPEPAKHSAKRK